MNMILIVMYDIEKIIESRKDSLNLCVWLVLHNLHDICMKTLFIYLFIYLFINFVSQ